MRIPDRVAESRAARAFRRYRRTDLEYPALRVVGRGLFLAVMLMLVVLLAFTRVTDLIVGQNEVIIPTTTVDPSVDLGQIVRGAFARTSGAVVSVLGVLTLVISSYVTARALRAGTWRALLGPSSRTPGWTDPGNAGVAVAVPMLVLTTWLLTLATTIRRSAWSELAGVQLSDGLVNAGKAGSVLLQLVLVAAAAIIAYRATLKTWPGWGSIAALVLLAAFVVACNYLLLYTYVGALLNPHVSAGIVLVISLLLWVNLVTRAYFGALCWIGERG